MSDPSQVVVTNFKWSRNVTHNAAGDVVGYGLTADVQFIDDPKLGLSPGFQPADGLIAQLLAMQGGLPDPMPGYQRGQETIMVNINNGSGYGYIYYKTIERPILDFILGLEIGPEVGSSIPVTVGEEVIAEPFVLGC